MTGAFITTGAALRVPAVACAVGLIAETVGALPVKIFDAGKLTRRDHPAYRLIHDEANPWTSAAELRAQLTADALLNDHGGFALVVRASDGRPLELHRLDPAAVRLDAAPDGSPLYIVATNTGPASYGFADVLHVRAFGGSPISLGREAIALAIAFEDHIGSLFRNGGRPSGIIKSPKILDVDAKRKLAASWFTTHSGRNSGGTAILDEGMDYQALSATLADSQFAENRLEQIREIARAFRIPVTMLGELSRGTWSNLEEQNRQFLQFTLRPWLRAWEWAYARCLLTPDERRELTAEFVTDDLLTTSHAARATAYGQYRAMSAMTANEVRAGLNLPAHPDGDTLENPHITTGGKSETVSPLPDEESA
ncbi:phage portal protein [Cereibacter sphaeroides]|uniref:phage portal protein n=1 Tax=Cereibacter sphaeroides TaxID=1063 RepID=UPI001D0E6A02|nr:phage portal protein [Cereibacter sphaeroides]